MTRSKSALAVLLLTIVAAVPAVAEQDSVTPSLAASEFCTGCFAYLEFPPPLEPESYAMRGQALETSASSPAADEGNGLLREHAARLLAVSK